MIFSNGQPKVSQARGPLASTITCFGGPATDGVADTHDTKISLREARPSKDNGGGSCEAPFHPASFGFLGGVGGRPVQGVCFRSVCWCLCAFRYDFCCLFGYR